METIERIKINNKLKIDLHHDGDLYVCTDGENFRYICRIADDSMTDLHKNPTGNFFINIPNPSAVKLFNFLKKHFKVLKIPK